MKLDATDIRYLTADEFRILTATEMGSKNHEVVPASLIAQISGVRSGAGNKLMGQLAKRNLIARVQNIKYDGYRLTYGGYDYLAIRAMAKRDSLYSVGSQIGVGKESDIYVVADKEGNKLCMKMHRLGRISFRAIKEKRDYMGKRKSATWMYMSRLAAQKEWAFMKVLHANGFPVPTPIDQSRHCIIMSLVDGYALRQVAEHPNPGRLYSQLMTLLVRFARAGLIHGDFNEFNILIRDEDGEPVVIDFPQLVSTNHKDAEWYFNRDVACIRTFFRRRFNYESKIYPRFRKALSDDSVESFTLDVQVAASGFGKNEAAKLDSYMAELKGEDGSEEEEDSDEEEEEEEEEEEDEEEEEEEEEEGKETKEEEIERLMREADEEDAKQAPALVSNLADTLSSTTLSATAADTSSNPEAKSDSDSESEEEEEEEEGDESKFETDQPRAQTRKSHPHAPHKLDDVRSTVQSDLTRDRARSQAKYHARTAPGKLGNKKGTKKKNEGKSRLMKAEKSGANDGW